MFDRISNGWAIAQQSWQVLRKDKELLLLPVLSGLASILVTASFIAPIFLVPGLLERFQAAINTGHGHKPDQAARVAAAVLTFAFYFLNYFVIVFFNTALAACAVIRFKGGDPTVGDGLRVAGQRLPQILGWSLLASTVG